MAVHFILGGKGDMTGAKEDNGGAYDPAVRTWNESQGDNGTWLDQTFSGVISDNGSGKVRVTDDGMFTNALVGVYVNLQTVNYTDATYRIDAIDEADGNYVDLDLSHNGNNDTGVFCRVGGAIGDDIDNDDYRTLEIATDLAVAGDRIKVRNIMTFSSIFDVNIDGNDGTSIAHIRVLAVDINGDRDLTTKVVVTVSGTPGVPVIHLSNNVKYWDFLGFDFNGNSNSLLVLQSTGSETYNSFYSCIFRDPIINIDVITFTGDYLYMYDCEVYGATGGSVHGIFSKSQNAIYDSCYVHDNTGNGFNIGGVGAGWHRIFDCRIINNNYGIFTTLHAANLMVVNSTIADNDSDGIKIDSNLTDWTVTHCNLTGNGGYGIHTNGNGPRSTVFQYNNAFANTSGVIDVGASAWGKVSHGNNMTLDPMYDSDFFTRNINLIQGGIGKRPIGPRHRIWKPPLGRGAA